MVDGEIRVGAGGMRFGISDSQFWIETNETGTVVLYWRGEKDRHAQYAFVNQLIASLCVLKRAIEP